MISNTTLVLILSVCVVQINARTYFDSNWGDHDDDYNGDNHNNWRTSNNYGKSNLLDLNDQNDAKSQQVFIGPLVRFFLRVLPRGLLIIPSTALEPLAPPIGDLIEKNGVFVPERPRDNFGQNIKHKKQKKQKPKKPEYQTV